MLNFIYVTIAVDEDRAAVLADAMEAAERAIRLAPNRGDGYSARAAVRGTQNDWLGAEQDSRAAQERGFTNASNFAFLLSAGI